MESEAAAMEREEALQDEVDELKEKERRRIELMKKMEEAEALSAPAPPASIAVAPRRNRLRFQMVRRGGWWLLLVNFLCTERAWTLVRRDAPPPNLYDR